MNESVTKMACPYCQEPFMILLDEPGILQYISKSDKEFYLTTEIGNIGFSNLRLSYCPMCGRNLAVDK